MTSFGVDGSGASAAGVSAGGGRGEAAGLGGAGAGAGTGERRRCGCPGRLGIVKRFKYRSAGRAGLLMARFLRHRYGPGLSV
jgi:hypothetical protein